MNQFKQICKLLGPGWFFQDWIPLWQIFSHLCSCTSECSPTTTPQVPASSADMLISWKKKTKKLQNKIQVSTCLKSHVLQSLVIQSKSRTEPCDKKVTIPTCESGGWIITWGKGWACCSFVLNHSSSSMGAPLPRLESSQGVSDDPKSRWIIPPVNPYLG